MNIKYIILITLLVITINSFGQASEKSTIQTQIESKRFVFRAQTATPQRGGLIQLTSVNYTLDVKPDTIVCDLPYYGRSYQATYNPSDVGMKFTSYEFEYTVKPRKKKGWNISIRTKDVAGIRANMTVFEDGAASLYITSNDRQSISYSGHIEEKK